MDFEPLPPAARVTAMMRRWTQLSLGCEDTADAPSRQQVAERIISDLITDYDLDLAHPLLLPLLACARDLLEEDAVFPTESDIEAAMESLAQLERCERLLTNYAAWLATPRSTRYQAERSIATLIRTIFDQIRRDLPTNTASTIFTIPAHALMRDPAEWLLDTISTCAHPALSQWHRRMIWQLHAALDIPDDKPLPSVVRLKQVPPEDYFLQTLAGTPFEAVCTHRLPYGIPPQARFEHIDILAGSGHGKTQCLEALILADIERAQADPRFGFAVMDNQGDLLRRLGHLKAFDPTDPHSLADRLTIIDPAHPVGLNLFDLQLERYAGLDKEKRAQAMNGVLDLYRYLFAELFRAQLTQKQGVVFSFLAKLLFVLPNPTIYLLKDVLEEPHRYADYIRQLKPEERDFFDKHFFHRTYFDTRQQIITRLYGLITNFAFEPMFRHPKNTVDMFHAIQHGRIVFINTAKDLLKTDDSRLFGRFFIALITQAVNDRAGIAEAERSPFHVYIDEAWEYLDDKVIELANQARKYRVGLTLTHPNLDNISAEIRGTLFASVGTKLYGGGSASDAAVFAREMHTRPEFLHRMRKARDGRSTRFALDIRHQTDQVLEVTLPFGVLDQEPKMSESHYQQLVRRHEIVSDAAAPDVEPPQAPETPMPPVADAPRDDSDTANEPTTSRSRRRSL